MTSRIFSRKPLVLAMSFAFAAGPVWAQESTAEPVTVDVTATRYDADAVVAGKELNMQRAANVDTATLMTNVSGVAFQVGGAVSSIPVIRGLADDRISVLVDGVDAIAACPNHMNTPLSYIDPSSVKSLRVFKSITPVSIAGNSIGGAVVVSTGQPQFADAGKKIVTGNVGGFYSSNGDGRGANLSVTAATDWLSVTYKGSTSQQNNYKAGGNFKPQSSVSNPYTTSGTISIAQNEVASTAYESTNQSVALALKHDKHTVQLQYSWQDIPYELYPNQRMDMTGNTQERYNLRYWGGFDWGNLEAQYYHENLNHQMDFGPDKQYWYGSNNSIPGMPMYTNSNTDGVKVKGDIQLSDTSLLRTGAEYQHYYLNDYWPASGTRPVSNMAPYTFQNINGGLQQISSVFTEWEKQFDPQFKSLLGIRYSLVNSSTGNVHGYNTAYAPPPGVSPDTGNQARDAGLLNTANRNNNFNDVDVVATASYKASQHQDVELGVSRQVRAPNLYELYSWSSWSMAASMNNYVGDGNGYFGNPDLKPETAYTASVKYDLHTEDREWQAKAEPFYSYVENYIDAVQWNSTTNAPQSSLVANQFNVLRYVNQNANLAGIDLDGQMPIAKTDFGRFTAQGLFSWTYGKNLVTGYGLYNVMPVNGKVNFTHRYGAWDNQLQFVAVANKNNFLSVERNEIPTPGYFLTNLKGSYSWANVRIDAGINNVFNTLYYQPLGGAYVGQGQTMALNKTSTNNAPVWGTAVPGMGISYYTALNVKF